MSDSHVMSCSYSDEGKNAQPSMFKRYVEETCLPRSFLSPTDGNHVGEVLIV